MTSFCRHKGPEIVFQGDAEGSLEGLLSSKKTPSSVITFYEMILNNTFSKLCMRLSEGYTGCCWGLELGTVIHIYQLFRRLAVI